MSRTIKAIERHMIRRSSRVDREATARQGIHAGPNGERQLVAEWQPGPETLSGHALRKLRLALVPTRPVITPSPVGAG